MADVWPQKHNLTLDTTHMVWKFVHGDLNSVTLMCALEGHQVSQVDLHISFLPALACFDIEYWRILLLPHTLGRQDNRLRVETEQRYMQNIRLAITDSLLGAERSKLKSGVSRIDVLHQWCTRTWNGFSHSTYGRGQYVQACTKENIIPYAREITKLKWTKYFNRHAQSYRLFQEQMPISPLIHIPAGRKALSAFDMLTVIGLIPAIPNQNFLGNRSLGDLVNPYLGTHFPQDADTVQWFTGHVTLLPRINCNHGRYRGDEDLVRAMATSPDGGPHARTVASDRHRYIVVDLPKRPLPSFSMDETIRAHLSDSRCVIVKGQTLEGPDSFTEEEIEAYKGSLAQQVEWQDATRRAIAKHDVPPDQPAHVHSTSNLKEFIQLASNPEVLGNLLDMKATMAPIPAIISRLSDDSMAWNMTHHECHAHMPERISTNPNGKRDAPPTLPKTEQPLAGPQAVRFDSFSMLRWSLIAHGGYVTYPHKDANGLCTWVFAHVGVKIWAIREPKYSDPEHNTRRGQFKLHYDMMMQGWELDPVSGMYTTFLATGDMIIMPPGVWHAVYTATPSFTSGGHFFTYDTLHLTEFSRAFDSKYSEYSTNSNHQVDRILARMVLALPTVSQRRTLYRRPVLALARMVFDPKAYVPQSEKKRPDLKLSPQDVLAREEHYEHLAAEAIMKQILGAAHVSENELKSAVESNGVKWYERGEAVELPWAKMS